MRKVLISSALVFLVFAVLAGGYLATQWFGGYHGSISLDETKACTEEAKICPDGSAVGRVGPDCEFAPCPTAEPSPLLDGAYQGRLYPFRFIYPPGYMVKTDDIADSSFTIEQVIITSQVASEATPTIKIRVQPTTVTQLPSTIQDRPTSGAFGVLGEQAPYLSIDSGSQINEPTTPDAPQLLMHFIHQGRLYQLTFIGTKDILNPTVQQTIKTLKDT